MKLTKLFLIIFGVLAPVIKAADLPVTAKIDDIKGSADQYLLILKQGGRTVVSVKRDYEGGVIGANVNTFSTNYCGVPVQVVVIKDNFSPPVCKYGEGSYGYNWDFLIYNQKSWSLIDEFQQNDYWFCGGNRVQTNAHADGEHTIAVLRSGHYYGPKCRIFDLYTKPLPSKGPSFDCRTASNRAEETVCKHPKLAALDHAYGARLRDRLLKEPAPERQDSANGYYWDMQIRDDAGTNVNELAKAYQKALGTDSAQFFREKTPAPAAQADCAQAHTPSEKAICANPKLKDLDDQLARAYHQAFTRTQPKSTQREALIHEQRTWLQSVNACQGKVSCLQQSYEGRIRILHDKK